MRRLSIPLVEQGYRHCHSQVIDSQDRLDEFIAAAKRDGRWYDLEAFAKVVADAKSDFAKQSLALIFDTEASGSIRVRFRVAEEKDGSLTVRFYREFPVLQTMNWRYRGYALVVDRMKAKTLTVWRQEPSKETDVWQKEETLDLPGR